VQPHSLRWLHPDDPLRRGYGPEEPPPKRTHSQACTEAKDSESAAYSTWNSDNHVRLKTGINHWCPLSVLNKFDMIWDFCPDIMHIVKTFFERLVIGVFSGSRRPTPFAGKEPKELATGATAAERQEFMYKTRKYTRDLNEYTEACKAFDECKFDEIDKKIVDERVQNLGGYPYWIRSSMVHARTLHTYNTHNLRISLQFPNTSFNFSKHANYLKIAQ
jgi:hypothetical protein